MIVTSGAIARGIADHGPRRPAVGDGRPAGRERGRPGQALPRLRRAAARARRHVSAQVLLTFFDVGAPHALPQRPPDAAPAARLARRPGHQRERHDGDRRDLLRRQRLPRRAGRDPRRRRPARAADRQRRALHRRPARATRGAPLVDEVDGLRELEALRDRPRARRRSARAGCARRSSRPRWRPRRGSRRRSATACATACSRRALGGRGRRHALRAAGAAPLVVQAVAEVRQARARARSSSTPAPRARCARAAPRCCRSGSSRSTATSTRATPSRSAPADGVVGKGIANYAASDLRRVHGPQVRRRARRAAAGDRRGRAPRLLRPDLSRR